MRPLESIVCTLSVSIQRNEKKKGGGRDREVEIDYSNKRIISMMIYIIHSIQFPIFEVAIFESELLLFTL